MEKYQNLLFEYRENISNLKLKHKELSANPKEQRNISIKITNLIDKYVAVITNQAKILWDNKDFESVESLFSESADICNKNKVFRVNLAHSVYMQEKNHAKAIEQYEPIVEQYKDNYLKCETIVLANLCVSYILRKQNAKAESLIKQIEEHEKIAKINDPSQQVFHSCIVHLVIGTLY